VPGRFGFSKDLNPVVDLFFEFVLVDEAVELQSAEEMVDTFGSALATTSRNHACLRLLRFTTVGFTVCAKPLRNFYDNVLDPSAHAMIPVN